MMYKFYMLILEFIHYNTKSYDVQNGGLVHEP